MQTTRGDVTVVRARDPLAHWPVNWSAVWVGALATISTALIIGLIGIALGAHQARPTGPIVRWSDFGLGALVFSILGAFVSFIVGGWIAGKIAGFRRSEPSILHAGITWLVAVPILLVLATLGAGGFMGAWFSGLAGTPAWVALPTATPDPNAAIAARNAALGALTGLLTGLVGSVIGGWMSSGEPMTFTHYRVRDEEERRRAV